MSEKQAARNDAIKRGLVAVALAVLFAGTSIVASRAQAKDVDVPAKSCESK